MVTPVRLHLFQINQIAKPKARASIRTVVNELMSKSLPHSAIKRRDSLADALLVPIFTPNDGDLPTTLNKSLRDQRGTLVL